MKRLFKRAEDLQASDLEAFPVWEFANNDEIGETVMRPVKSMPVNNLRGRLVSTQVSLACGQTVLAALGNIDSNNPKSTKHFIQLIIFHSGKKFILARYHDFDWKRRGPQALADFLRMRIEDVFPISYDVSRFSKGSPAALVGTIDSDPRDKLSRAQIIALAVPKIDSESGHEHYDSPEFVRRAGKHFGEARRSAVKGRKS